MSILIFRMLVRQPVRFALFLALVSPTTVRADGCIDYGAYAHWVRTAFSGIPMNGITVAGTQAYVTGIPNGVQILDLSDPGSPVLLGRLSTPGRDVAVSGSLAYVAALDAGLQIFDISNPVSPQRAGSLPIPGAIAIAVDGRYAYLLTQQAGLNVVEVSDPASPVLLANVATAVAWDVALHGSYALVACGDSGLQVFDVSNPASPAWVAEFDTPGSALAVKVAGDRAYIADNYGILAVDVHDPRVPVGLGGVGANGALDLAVEGDRIYVAQFGGVLLIDAADPSFMVLRSTIAVRERVLGVAVAGGFVLATQGYWGGLHVLQVENPDSPPRLGSALISPRPLGIAFKGDRAYVAGATLDVLDVSIPSAPRVLGSAASPPDCQDVAFDSGRAYVAALNAGLQIVDVSDPFLPHEIARIDTPEQAYGVAIRAPYAYVADGYNSGLQVIDIQDPTRPTIAGSLDTPGFARGVALTATPNIVCVTGAATGLHFVDVSIPRRPRLLATADTPGEAWRVTVVGTRAYVADRGAGLQIVDIGDPAQPRLLGHVDTPDEAWDVAVVNDIAYLAVSSCVFVIDVSDPVAPRIVGGTDGRDWGAFSLAAGDGFLGVARGAGFELLPLQCSVSTPVSVDELGAFAEAGSIRIRWRAHGGVFAGFDVERAAGNAGSPLAYRRLNESPVVGDGLLEFEDREVVPFESYAYRVVGITRDGDRSTFGPVHASTRTLDRLGVRAFPNPARGTTSFMLRLPEPTSVRLQIYDAAGRVVHEMQHPALPAGAQVSTWDGHDGRGLPVASGVYTVRIETPLGRVATERLVLVR